MKKAGILAASVAAVVFTSGSGSPAAANTSTSDEGSASLAKDAGSGARRGAEKETFAPRFDGLRFIETLVTAHR